VLNDLITILLVVQFCLFLSCDWGLILSWGFVRRSQGFALWGSFLMAGDYAYDVGYCIILAKLLRFYRALLVLSDHGLNIPR